MAIDLQALVLRVRSKDYAAQIDAKDAGAAAVPELVSLLQDPDEEVRLLAVHCLVATGDPGAATGLGWALFDADDQVAMAAVKGLHAVATPAQAKALLRAYDKSGEPLVKREAALVLGRVAADADVPEMKARWEKEADPDAKQGLCAALAKLGDPEARAAFEEGLDGSNGRGRVPWLELSEYIGQTWLLPALGRVLDDPTPVIRVAIDTRPDMLQALRACDVALVVIAQITGATFSFPVTRSQNFTPDQIDEVQIFVEAQAPAP
jgi:HEAT repeat protein